MVIIIGTNHTSGSKEIKGERIQKDKGREGEKRYKNTFFFCSSILIDLAD